MGIQKTRNFFLMVCSLVTCALLFSACGNSVDLPTTSSTNLAGTWTGTFHVNNSLSDCDPLLLLPAKATFEQNGSTVTGVLKATGPCALDYPFEGKIEENRLSGILTGGLDPIGSASGTLSGSTLQITAYNGFQYDMGTMNLHR